MEDKFQHLRREIVDAFMRGDDLAWTRACLEAQAMLDSLRKAGGEHPRRRPSARKRPRDDRGWIIPSPGTKAEKIYALMVKGYTRRQIYLVLRLTCGQVGGTMDYITGRRSTRRGEQSEFNRERELAGLPVRRSA